MEIFLDVSFLNELSIDQSISHNGVCLTVDELNTDSYRVTAIAETLKLTNLGDLKKGDLVNIERCMKVGGRLDGHMVQGHVDHTVKCLSVKEEAGSHVFSFEYKPSGNNILVYKGSVCLNGVSLTLSALTDDFFSVSIIPYTFEHTNFNTIKAGDEVNIEYDIIGKYIAAYLSKSQG